jgi:hypothetical protein
MLIVSLSSPSVDAVVGSLGLLVAFRLFCDIREAALP